MALLTLFGITIPVAAASNGTIEITKAGTYGRSYNNTPYSSVRSRAPDYMGQIPLTARTTATAYRLLIEGRGEVWAFATAGSGATADTYSTKGRYPTSTSGTPDTMATGGPGDDLPGRLTLLTGETVVYTVPLSPISQYTVACWLKSTSTGGVWAHYMIEFPGAPLAWINGGSESAASLTNGFASVLDTGTGVLTLGDAAEDVEYAGLTYLPFRASALKSDWAADQYAGGTGVAVEDLPYLNMGGTWPVSGADVVLGEVLRSQLVDTVVSGSTVQFESFDFVLRSTGTVNNA